MKIPEISFLKSLPSDKRMVIVFFIKLSLLFSAWFIIYQLLLNPNRIIDRPLTNFITSSVVKCINTLSSSSSPASWIEDYEKDRNYVIINNTSVFGIFDVCNGLDLIFIYLSIILLLPYKLKRKLIFAIIGIIAIVIANIIRVYSLYYIYIHYKTAFDFSHHYLFTILMYILIFYGWLLFIKNGKLREKGI